ADVKVKGLAELNQFLSQLPAKVEANVLRGALRAGANVVADEVKTQAPVATGELRDSFKVRTSSRKGVAMATVRTKVFYARFIEFGVAAHKIVGKANGVLRFGDTTVRVVDHPGIRPRPFMRPALDSKAGAATVAAAEYMKRRLSTKEGLNTSDIEIGIEE
ncbi:MAG: HK97 gp10 family phage protein, partial [Comamonadaceae bacterium]